MDGTDPNVLVDWLGEWLAISALDRDIIYVVRELGNANDSLKYS